MRDGSCRGAQESSDGTGGMAVTQSQSSGEAQQDGARFGLQTRHPVGAAGTQTPPAVSRVPGNALPALWARQLGTVESYWFSQTLVRQMFRERLDVDDALLLTAGASRHHQHDHTFVTQLLSSRREDFGAK